jgi:hypothetical protein
MNIYQYIPTLSEHAPHVFNWFVLQEICRIRLSCTSDQDFQHMNSLFANRLFARGYSNTIHSQAITKLPTRAQLLQILTDNVNAEPNTHDPPSKIIATFEEPLRMKEIAWKTILTIPKVRVKVRVRVRHGQYCIPCNFFHSKGFFKCGDDL